MRPKEYILLAASIAMICMLIIPKIIKYEHAQHGHGHGRPIVDLRGGMKSALDQFQVDNGHYPASLQDLVQQPTNASNWHGPYLDPPKLTNDPWGHSYIYVYPGKHDTNRYDLLSLGPDGKEGTADDIGSWQ